MDADHVQRHGVANELDGMPVLLQTFDRDLKHVASVGRTSYTSISFSLSDPELMRATSSVPRSAVGSLCLWHKLLDHLECDP
jgi:hypothetical protein